MRAEKQLSLMGHLVNEKSQLQSQQIAKQQLNGFGLADDAKKVPSQFSGGMAQRLSYLCATAAGGEVLIADEPTSRLDPITAAATMRLLIEQTQGIDCALLLISHDLVLIEKIYDKVFETTDFI